MNIQCIYCKIENLSAELSDEHIIPQVLGGVFKISVVCKEHNEKFGHTLESELKRNGFIVTAIDKLKLQPPNLAYREATIRINLDNEVGLKGYIDEHGAAKIFPQDSTKEYKVIPEEQAIEVLKKQVERFEKKTAKKVKFNFDDFDKLPYDITIPVYGTPITFIKRKTKGGSVLMHDLNQPISFRVIAKIALTHLAALYYPFVMKAEFDAIKDYILHGGLNRFVIIHTLLKDVEPKSINYLPYHYIRLKFVEKALTAIVCLFGTIKFMVYFDEFYGINEFKHQNLLDSYHVYDIKNKSIFPSNGDDELRNWDDMLLESVRVWGKYKKNHPNAT